eukprot:TRINITY_DN35458_c0_g1_i1.p2 TRINITY_DN35458_c0_g1~~TRINITY_DN35458_c0_g1_i1.p2  ORF type:complete len:141 (+),score=11.39 TRINITY_DN35458_c0_g1_i1:617-1039(+)
MPIAAFPSPPCAFHSKQALPLSLTDSDRRSLPSVVHHSKDVSARCPSEVERSQLSTHEGCDLQAVMLNDVALVTEVASFKNLVEKRCSPRHCDGEVGSQESQRCEQANQACSLERSVSRASCFVIGRQGGKPSMIAIVRS